MRVTPLRSILATLSVLSVFHAGCAAKSREQASSSAPPCTNYILFINNNTDSSVRIYRGTEVFAEVHPTATKTIVIRTSQDVIYRAVFVRPEAAIAANPGDGGIVIRPPRQGEVDRTGSLSPGVQFHRTCQE